MRVIVIGAGLAGIAAAQSVKSKGIEVEVLEARQRIGGRLWTNREFCDFPVEFGAEFVHGDEISTQPLVKKLGLRTIRWRKTDDSMVRLEDGRFLSMQEARAQDALLDAVRAWRLPPSLTPLAQGESFAAFLRRAGFNPTQIQYVRRMFANACGADPEDLDAEEAMHDLNSYASNDYRLLDGYDRMVEDLAQGLDITLGCVVNEVKWDSGVTVRCADGSAYTADKAIVTLPVGILKSGQIKFTPELPLQKRQALSKLEMGAVSKIIMRFDQPIYRTDIGAIFSAGVPPMLWSPSIGRGPTKYTVWSGFFSGRYADELYALSDKDAIERALNTLRREIGDSSITPSAATFVRWRDDPFSLGGYSYCIPGGFPARAQLGAPTPPLFWAGEATAPSSTVHGAMDSGRRAAEEISSRKG